MTLSSFSCVDVNVYANISHRERMLPPGGRSRNIWKGDNVNFHSQERTQLNV